MAQPQSFDPTAAGPAASRPARLVAAPADPTTTLDTTFYTTHYSAVVRLAAALGVDTAQAPATADAAFIEYVHGRGRRRRDETEPTSALCACLLRQSRSRRPRPAEDPPAVDPARPAELATVVSAVTRLAAPRREGLVLRHFAGLSARDIAGVTGRRLARVRDDVHRGEAQVAASMAAPVPTTGELHALLRVAIRSRLAALDETARTPDPARFAARLDVSSRRRRRKTTAVVLSLVVVTAVAATAVVVAR